MEKNELQINNNISLEKNNTQTVNFEEQKSFLETNLGQVINAGVDLGIRALLPGFLEENLIEIKDSIITDGFKAGIKTAIDNTIDMGKSFLGIFTGKFDNMSQIKEAIKKGGLIDSISNVLDWGIKKAKENKLIKSSTASLIKKGKNSILNNISDNIENNLTSQVESIEKIDKYTQNWSKYYEKKDFTNMERQFNKIQKELEKVVPLESVITKARQLENIHNLIKNNGKNFNLTQEELELANKLV